MASKLRTPTLGLAGLSMCLCLAIVGTAGRSLHVYYHEHTSNPWLLPIWPNHFDIRELHMLIACAGAIFVLNAVLASSLLMAKLPANGIVLGSALLSTLVGIVSISFTTVINWRAPTTDTLKTWTCRWSYADVQSGLGPPNQFQSLCHKTRFAYFSTIPVFVIQVLLLCLGVYALFSRRPQRTGHQDLEKNGHQLKPVSNVRNVSFDTRGSESPQSYQDSARILGGKL